MATTKKRINISVSDAIEQAVATLAQRDNVPQATKVTQLLQLALEIEEDTYFSQLVQERLRESNTAVSHDDAWV